VITGDPTCRLLVVTCAVFPTSGTGAPPFSSVPSLEVNVTLPVGVPAPGGVTLRVAVKVTLAPNGAPVGAELDSATLVSALLTVCVSVLELPLKFESPL
jgi:hypothetical protein